MVCVYGNECVALCLIMFIYVGTCIRIFNVTSIQTVKHSVTLWATQVKVLLLLLLLYSSVKTSQSLKHFVWFWLLRVIMVSFFKFYLTCHAVDLFKEVLTYKIFIFPLQMFSSLFISQPASLLINKPIFKWLLLSMEAAQSSFDSHIIDLNIR